MKVVSLGANKTLVTLNNGTVVGFCYQTPVVAEVDGCIYRTSKKWSVTTSKHCGVLMREMTGSYAGEKPQEFFDALGDAHK